MVQRAFLGQNTRSEDGWCSRLQKSGHGPRRRFRLHRKSPCHWTIDAGDEADSGAGRRWRKQSARLLWRWPVGPTAVYPHKNVCDFPAEENVGLALEE